MKFFRPPHMLEFLCAGTDTATRFALAAGNWWTGQVRPTTFAQCQVSPHALSRSMLIHKKTQEFKQA